MNLNEIRQFFGYDNAAQFRKEWMQLTPEEREQIKKGLTDGTYNY